jgi:micrococcal nuclease
MLALRYRLGVTLAVVALVGSSDGCLQREPLEHFVNESASRTGDGVGVVASITDGDTLRLEVDGRELRVRLIGIDTPEVYPDAECWGAEATEALARLAPVGSTLVFAYDHDKRDRYDRELMYLYDPEGMFINAALVEQGFAEAILVEPNDRHFDQLRTLERQARDSALGLWSNC